jgi:proteasome beta subunit
MTATGPCWNRELVRIMTVECSLYAIRRGRPISVGAASTLLSNVLNGNRYYPYYVQLLVGGVDDTGAVIYSVDAMGGATREDSIVATGSGSPMAYGVLEDRYRAEMNEDDAVSLAVRSLRAAMKRDSASGEGIHVVIITRDKYKELSDEDVQKRYAAQPA